MRRSGRVWSVGVLLIRPWRRSTLTFTSKLSRLLLPVLLAGAVTLTGCGGKSSSTGTRPTTTARLQIVFPTPNAVTPPDMTLKLNLIGARVVQPSTGKLRGDEGHIHVSLDGQLVSMAYGTTQDLHSLKPGAHVMQAEFVAVDHQPFRNRVVAGVLFTVKS